MSQPATIHPLPPKRLPDPSGLIGPATRFPRPSYRPVLGFRATCGFPSPAEDFVGDELDLNERCVRNPVATYFVEADTGTSMVDFGIYPGDTLVVDRSINAKHGDIVMVLWDGGYMIKQLSIRDRNVALLSGSSQPPIVVPPETELLVWGVVTWSFRRQFRRS